MPKEVIIVGIPRVSRCLPTPSFFTYQSLVSLPPPRPPAYDSMALSTAGTFLRVDDNINNDNSLPLWCSACPLDPMDGRGRGM